MYCVLILNLISRVEGIKGVEAVLSPNAQTQVPAAATPLSSEDELVKVPAAATLSSSEDKLVKVPAAATPSSSEDKLVKVPAAATPSSSEDKLVSSGISIPQFKCLKKQPIPVCVVKVFSQWLLWLKPVTTEYDAMREESF